MKIQRIARKEPKEHKKIDRMQPFKFEDLGTPNDPCFGKHYDLKAKECRKCGDCEICAIVSGQKNFIKQIETQEEKNAFKDLDEAALITSQNKSIAKYLKVKVDKKPGIWLTIDKLIPRFIKEFNLLDSDEQYVRQRIIKTVQETKGIKINKKLTKYTNA